MCIPCINLCIFLFIFLLFVVYVKWPCMSWKALLYVYEMYYYYYYYYYYTCQWCGFNCPPTDLVEISTPPITSHPKPELNFRDETTASVNEFIPVTGESWTLKEITFPWTQKHRKQYIYILMRVTKSLLWIWLKEIRLFWSLQTALRVLNHILFDSTTWLHRVCLGKKECK